MAHRKPKGLDCPTSPRAKFCRERKASPKAFDPRSLRAVKQGSHIIIIGCPKGKWSAQKKRCKVGTGAQTILHPKGEFR